MGMQLVEQLMTVQRAIHKEKSSHARYEAIQNIVRVHNISYHFQSFSFSQMLLVHAVINAVKAHTI